MTHHWNFSKPIKTNLTELPISLIHGSLEDNKVEPIEYDYLASQKVLTLQVDEDDISPFMIPSEFRNSYLRSKVLTDCNQFEIVMEYQNHTEEMCLFRLRDKADSSETQDSLLEVFNKDGMLYLKTSAGVKYLCGLGVRQHIFLKVDLDQIRLSVNGVMITLPGFGTDREYWWNVGLVNAGKKKFHQLYINKLNWTSNTPKTLQFTPLDI